MAIMEQEKVTVILCGGCPPHLLNILAMHNFEVKKMSTSSKIIAAAIVAEIILIATGLALAATMGLQAFSDHGNLMLAVSAAGFPLILAVLEVFKIPSGIALYKSNWLLQEI